MVQSGTLFDERPLTKEEETAMCGSDYCVTCTPTQEITDYAEGRSHDLPRFGDNAQRCVAKSQRARLLNALITAQDRRALDFPEVGRRRSVAGYLLAFARRIEPRFNLLVESMPAFAAHVAANPFAHRTDCKGKTARKRRKASRRFWREAQIESYMRTHGDDAVREMHDYLDCPIPWWLQAPPVHVPMAEKLGVAHMLTEPERQLELA